MRFFAFACGFACLFGAPLQFGAAQREDTQAVVRTLEARYKSAKTLRALFLERYREKGRDARIESGIVYFKRPGRMRWEYESPEAKLFLSDGKNVWFYVPADRTVLRSRVKESADWRTPFMLLVRNPRISELCKSVVLGDSREATAGGNAVLHCFPKANQAGSKDEILLEIDGGTGDLRRVLVQEGGNVEIEFLFGDWIRNPTIPEEKFVFHPPAGVAIVEGEPAD